MEIENLKQTCPDY